MTKKGRIGAILVNKDKHNEASLTLYSLIGRVDEIAVVDIGSDHTIFKDRLIKTYGHMSELSGAGYIDRYHEFHSVGYSQDIIERAVGAMDVDFILLVEAGELLQTASLDSLRILAQVTNPEHVAYKISVDQKFIPRIIRKERFVFDLGVEIDDNQILITRMANLVMIKESSNATNI